MLSINDLWRPGRCKLLTINILQQNEKNFTFFLQLLCFEVIVFIVLLIITLSQRVLSDLRVGGDKRGADRSPN